MLKNQKDLFSLDESISYLNGSYMSPQLNIVTQTGYDHLVKKSSPDKIGVDDFFKPRITLKKEFATLIGASDFNSIAIIPSVSYGAASVANNIVIEKGDEIVVCEAQFPSHIYSWQNLADRNDGRLVIVEAPPLSNERAKKWNERILNSINAHTKVVAIPQVHWADGTLFDLKSIRKRSSEVGAKLIIDGTQSIGAFPFSIKDIQPDALICASYKWLMGPYGIGVAYFAETFWEGQPIEHNWMNRYKSEDFANLTKYKSKYQPGAERYSVGESSNFVLVPMLSKSIEQVIEWNQSRIQEYCGSIIESGIDELRSKGCFIEQSEGRGNHLFGVYLPEKMNVEVIKKRLKDNDVFVSFRGNAIRVSPHVYNERSDFERFVDCVY